MPQNVFHTADALATAKYAGNQLAVFEDADALRSEQMVALANKMNYSETTLIEGGPPDDGCDVRIFMPDSEIPSARHPTLGTITVLRDHFSVGDKVMLNPGAGPTSAEVRGDGSDSEQYWMTQNAPMPGAELDRETLAEVLSPDANDFDADWPTQVVSAGLPAVMISLRDHDVLARSEVSTPVHRSFFDDVGVENPFPFCPDPRDDTNDFATRMYAPGHGVIENLATGSANGCLASYLARHHYFGDDEIEVMVEQGYETGRPSQLHLGAEYRGDEVVIRVGGCVEFVSASRLV